MTFPDLTPGDKAPDHDGNDDTSDAGGQCVGAHLATVPIDGVEPSTPGLPAPTGWRALRPDEVREKDPEKFPLVCPKCDTTVGYRVTKEEVEKELSAGLPTHGERFCMERAAAIHRSRMAQQAHLEREVRRGLRETERALAAEAKEKRRQEREAARMARAQEKEERRAKIAQEKASKAAPKKELSTPAPRPTKKVNPPVATGNGTASPKETNPKRWKLYRQTVKLAGGKTQSVYEYHAKDPGKKWDRVSRIPGNYRRVTGKDGRPILRRGA